MRPESAANLRDMLDSARAIVEYTRGKSESDYVNDRPIRDAVQWNFCVIGEALAKLFASDPACADRITEARRIVDFRNLLIHQYGVINHQVTWNIIETKLPVLVRELGQMLNDAP